MRYSYRWLKELSGTKKSPEQLAKLLMAHAFEVEGIGKFPHGLDGVMVGKVAGLEKHPNADKLRVAQVEFSSSPSPLSKGGKRGVEVRQIVCGAHNIAEGQKVAVALPGTVLPGNLGIKEAEIRGVRSAGMICSGKELGLGEDHSGILVLPEDAPIGAPFAKYLGLEDSIIEVKILPDRGSDALAYQGLAREIAALDGHAPHFADKPAKPIKVPSYNRAPKVVIADKKGCLRYLGLSFRDIVVEESPLWLKTRLMLSGLRPINNIVDITNYLMLLTGQPMHAFDADMLEGTITIRRARKNEKLTLLNGDKKKLDPEDLVIADSRKALAIAGVMGGADSAVTGKTKNIFFEIATFDGSSVRRTKTRHNLPTDASYRFERNLDPNLPTDTAREAVALLAALAHGTLTGMRDVYPKVRKPWKVSLSLERIESVLGTKLPLFEAVRHLALLGLEVKKVADRNALAVTVPTRRPDLRDEWDLIEEIGRMHGYDKIAPVAPMLPLVPTERNDEKRFEREVKEYLASAGFDEIMTYSFYGEKEIAGVLLPLDHHLELENPLSPEQKYLRMTPVPTMLRKVRENLRHFDRFDCFEWGSAFGRHPKTNAIGEVKTLLLTTVLPKKSERGEAFYAMKGKVEALFEALHIDTDHIAFEPVEKFPEIPVLAMLHPTRSACIMSGGKFIGLIGEFHPKTLKAFGLEPRVAIAGFLSDELRALQKREIVFEPLRKFPFAVRDISLTFSRKVTVSEVERLIREGGSPLLRHSELFDIYEQGDEKSFAFHLAFGAPDRTLESRETDEAFDRIVALAKERYMARLRD